MKQTRSISDIVIRWVTFREYVDEILSLRRRVFKEEQGYDEWQLASPRDDGGLHLAAFQHGELISVLSAYIYDNEPDALEALHLPPTSGVVLQYTKRVELQEHRGRHIGELLAAIMGCVSYDTLCPEYAFITLFKGTHARLQSYYANAFGFEYHATLDESEGGSTVMTLPDEAHLRAVYLKGRTTMQQLAMTAGVRIPSLVRFLEQTGRMNLVAVSRLRGRNLYTGPLSFQDELPRLSAQTRLLILEQKSRIASVDFPPAPARLLDAGAGPGVYLSRLAQESKFRGYDFVGLDLSPAMIAYARLNRPDVRWICADIYDTGEPDQSYEVVHANFLFIHLLNPALALREIHRILKPGGILYVLDVNDSTFEGPAVIKRLFDLHNDICEGNRSVLNVLPSIAEQHGFSPVNFFSTKLRNTASDNELRIIGDELHIDRRTSWGLCSFIAQRDELADQFKAAQEYYFTSQCEISLCIQTHVYRKEELPPTSSRHGGRPGALRPGDTRG